MKSKKLKYAKLLLQCLNLKNKKYLFIDIPSHLEEFLDILKEALKDYNLEDVYININDMQKKHDLMLYLDQENINKHPMFDHEIYNRYAKLDAAFLFINSMIPNLMDDIDPIKIKNTAKHTRSTEKYFRSLYENDKLHWCIAAVPNELWASKSLKMSESELWETIFKICLVDDETDPYDNWCKKLKNIEARAEILNNYHFEKLHYENSLGTDLTIYLPETHVWCAGSSKHGTICNLPTEEIFTSPQYDKTEGIVYSSKPLIYNNINISDFYLRFENGKVVDYKAKTGQEILKNIIENDDNSGYLGECALVDYDSPINNTNIIFNETLYDENASCHLALGMGFSECISEETEDVRSMGVNQANIHVDFMIGTNDLKIEGITKSGEKYTIFENGNFILN